MPFPEEPTPSREPASLPAGPEPSEFDRFKRLTKKIIQVPKREIDEKIREAQKKRRDR